MSKQAHHTIIFLILALLSYALWKYYFGEEAVEEIKPFTKGDSVENIELKITDETGALTAMFKSPKLIRYTDSPIVHITKPLFWTYEKGKQHWSIVSDKAEFNSDTQNVGLYDNLTAKTINTESQIEFNANNLLVDLKSKKANTTDGITIQQQNISMTGQIAQFDLKNETIEVNNNVKARYKTKK